MPLSCIGCCAANQEAIVSLVPTGGGITNVRGTWFTSVRAGHHVTVTAVTAPNNGGTWANIVWQHAVGGGGATATVNRSPLGPVRVSASLDNTKHVDLHFVELSQLVSATGTPNGPLGTWKCWVGAGTFAEITATPDPDWYRYRNEFTWAWADAGSLAGNNQSLAGASLRRRRVPLGHAGDVIAVTATLYEDSKTITIRVCQPPVLQLEELTFDGLIVECDDRGAFDRIWERNRIEPDPTAAAVLNPAGAVNSVLCFQRGTPITIIARLSVTTAPTDPEVVTVRGRATIGGVNLVWEQVGLAVAPADVNVTTVAMASGNLPNQVGCYDRVTITWEMEGPDGRTTNLRQTRHLIYTLLAAPVAPILGVIGAMPVPLPYWTLLEFSCRPAHGATTAAQLVRRSYAVLRRTTGDGNGPRRARDRQRLSYWLSGVNTAQAFTTQDLLGNGLGEGRCGAWASLLVDMFALHGEAARLTGVDPMPHASDNHLFLVKNCSFSGPGNVAAAPWTHAGNPVAAPGHCSKDVGAAGQGKTNPSFLFGDHAIVEYGGRVYDPSYGMSTHATVLSWEKAAICGLGDAAAGAGAIAFVQAGTALEITALCSPGFVEHVVMAAQTMATIGALYATTGNALWNHSYNRALRQLRPLGAAAVQVGDVVNVPRRGTNVAILRRL